MQLPAPVFIAVVAVVHVAAEDSDEKTPKASEGPITKGSPVGNTILLALVAVGCLVWLWIQYCEKMKTHKAKSSAARSRPCLLHRPGRGLIFSVRGRVEQRQRTRTECTNLC